MIITYDEAARAAYLYVKPEGTAIQTTENLDDKVLLHYDDQDEVCAIGILDVAYRPAVCLVYGSVVGND